MRYNGSMINKHPTSMRLTPTAKRLIEMLSENLGISNSAVIELAIRNLAQNYNIKLGDPSDGGDDDKVAS